VVRGGNALALRGESSARSDSADLLLPVSEEGPNSFLRVVTRSSSTALKHHHDSSPYDYHLAVFLPFSSTSSSSGGRFVFYGIQVDAARSQFGEIVAVGEKTCAPGTGGAELRDFDVILGGGREEDDPSTIWTVWDVRGETVVQRSGVGSALDEREGSDPSGGGADEMADEWETLLSPPLPAFTSTYFEDLLQSTTQSPAELFSSHLFYPSRFSPASLSSALDAYIATLISVLPYSSSSHPAALSASYGTLADKVAATVACHVQLESSAQTGELLQAEFDKKVRTEWLGFLARVEEAERDARWAVGVVKGHGGDSIVVVQRDGLIVPTKKSSVEIVSSLATIPSHDPIRSTFLSLLPGSLYLANPSLAPPQTRQATLHLASLGYALASSLPLPTILFVEADIVSLTSSALSCSVEDASLDLYANRVEPFLHESVISNVRNGIGGAGEPFESAVKTVLDWTISPNDPLLSPSSNSSTEIPSPTAIAFLSSSLRTTIDLRFALARNVLLVLLFALSELAEDELESSSLAPLISSALSVVQCLGNLKWLAGVTGAESAARLRAGATQDENALLNRFDSLKMSSEVSLSSPYPPSATTLPPSLLESILFSSAARLSQVTRNPPSTSIPSATTAFLSSTSLSSLRTLVQALPPDVELAEKLLLVGHVQAAYAFCARFPLEEGLAFVKGKAAMVLGKVEESEELFERVAAAFSTWRFTSVRSSPVADLLPVFLSAPSPPSSIPTLLAALPKQLHSGSLLDYYRHVSAFYDRLSLDTSIVKFANLAIEAAASLSASSEKSGSDTKDLWSKLFKSTVALGNYEDAYMILTTNPYRET
jgi:nuclear pore complex protein Nup160